MSPIKTHFQWFESCCNVSNLFSAVDWAIQAEYMAISDAAREAEARRQFYQELQFTLTPILLSDNQGALEISEIPSKYQKIKHVDIRYHYIRHQISNNRIILNYIPSDQNPADILAKSLGPTKHYCCIESICISD